MKLKSLIVACLCAAVCSLEGAMLPPAIQAKLEEHLPLSFYATPRLTSRAGRVYPLISQTKRQYEKTLSVNVAEDELVLLEFSPDKKVVNVAYPVGSKRDYLTGWFKVEDVLDLGQLKLKPPAEYVSATQTVRHLLYQARAQGAPNLVGSVGDVGGAIKLGERHVKYGRGEDVYHLLCLTSGSAHVGDYQLAGRLVLAREVEAFKEENYRALVQQMIGEYAYRTGRFWDNSTHPIVVTGNGNGGCAAFATDFAGYVFGKRNFNTGDRFDDPNDIRSGDVIALKGHYITVLERYPDGRLLTMDGNCNKSIRRSTTAYSIVNGQLKGGEFRNGWHYLSKELEPTGPAKRRRSSKR